MKIKTSDLEAKGEMFRERKKLFPCLINTKLQLAVLLAYLLPKTGVLFFSKMATESTYPAHDQIVSVRLS